MLVLLTRPAAACTAATASCTRGARLRVCSVLRRLPVVCLRAVRDGLEDMLVRVVSRHADASAPGWVVEAEERQACVHG